MFNKFSIRIFKYLLIFHLFNISIFAQNIETLSLNKLDELFLKNNFQLLTAKYNIDIANAKKIQEEIWDNPVFTIEQNAYNPVTKRVLDFTQTGNTAIQIDQLIQLAGKRNKRISIADLNKEISINQFYDLIRELKFQLHQNFMQLYYNQENIKLNNELLNSLDSMENSMKLIYEKGNISLKELMRIKSMKMNLFNDIYELNSKINESISNIKILTGIKTNFIPEFSEKESTLNYNFEELKSLAIQNRNDLISQKTQLKSDSLNLALQNSMMIPDLTISGRWDRSGNYVNNYTALMLQIPLPIFNRNQGNIEAAEYSIKSDFYQTLEMENHIQNELELAFKNYNEALRIYNEYDKNFVSDFKKVVDGVKNSYEKRNIGLLEFIDFYQTYKDNVINLNKIKLNRALAIEQLNYCIGKEILIN